MSKKAYLPETEKRTATIAIVTTETAKAALSEAAKNDNRTLSSYCETVLREAIKSK
jgi:hypothetical protein